MKEISSILLLLSLILPVSAQNRDLFFPPPELTTVGAYYYPEHWDSSQWERDLKKMSEMGFEFTHFGEFAWGRLEPEEGKYDFGWLDKAVALAARYNLGVVMCTSTATPPVWLTRKHPEILMKNEDGTLYDHGARQHASFSSNFFREYSLKMVEQLALRYGNDPRIIGWQIDNEPRKFMDYSDDAHQRFRRWLKGKYKTIDALNRAWGTRFWSSFYSDFEQINIPRPSQWGTNLHQRLDHNRFADWETSSFVDEQAAVIRKKALPGQWITTNYIPMYDVGYIGQSRELDFVTYTRYMVYGGDRGIGPKGYRVGEYTRIGMANDFFRPMHGYYGLMELQPGQVNWGSINPQPLPGAVKLWLWHIFAGGSKFTCTYRFRAPIYGYEQYHYGIVGPDGVTPTPGGLEFSEFINEVALLRRNFNPAAKLPESYQKRKTAILFDAGNVMAINMSPQTREWNTEAHFLKYYKALKSFGSPVDFISDSVRFEEYPVLIVPALQQISRSVISKLKEYAEEGGHLVMSVRSGHQDQNGQLWEAPFAAPIRELIGAAIEFYDLLPPYAPDTVVFDGKRYTWTSWGEVLQPDSGTETWATFSGDFYSGKPAVTHFRTGKGSVTYVGADTHGGNLEKDVLRKLFRVSGIAVENYPPGVIVEYRDGFGIAMNYGDTPFEMKIPAGAEIMTGSRVLGQGEVVVWKN